MVYFSCFLINNKHAVMFSVFFFFVYNTVNSNKCYMDSVQMPPLSLVVTSTSATSRCTQTGLQSSSPFPLVLLVLLNVLNSLIRLCSSWW